MSDRCPSCGYKLGSAPDRVIERGRLRLDPLAAYVQYAEARLALGPTKLLLLYALASAPGVVTRDALLGAGGIGSVPSLQVHLTQMRRTFEQVGYVLPVRNVPGRGYAWRDDA